MFMKSTLSLFVLFAILLTLASSFTIKSAESSPPQIQNQKEYAQYINALLGYNLEGVSQSLKQFVRENKLSIMNAAEDVTLVLANSLPANEETLNEFKISSDFLKGLGFNAKNVHCKNMVGKTENEIAQFVSQQSSTNRIHIIQGDQQQLQQLEQLFSSHNARLLEEQSKEEAHKTKQQGNAKAPNAQSTYIIKFFFILMFLIVLFGSFGAITGMNNGKDTLLYAKFIADVGR